MNHPSSPAQTLGVAILGGAHPHAEAVPHYVQQCAGVAVRWVWDPMASRARALAQLADAPIADRLEVALDDPAVHAVLIFSETEHHDQLIEAALAAGKHLYVDKPLAVSAERAWRQAESIAVAPTLFSSGFVLRRRPHHLLLRQLIQQNAFGRITRMRCSNGHAGALKGLFDCAQRQWFTDRALSGGGGFLDEGTHAADLVMWLLGRRPQRVTAALASVTGRLPTCEEYGQGLMAFDDGVVAAITGSWVEPSKAVTLEISGTEGCAVVLADKQLYLTTPQVAGADGTAPWRDLPAGWPHPQAVFLDALRGVVSGERVTAEEAAAAAAVIATMMRAADAGCWLEVPAPATAVCPTGVTGHG